jgi:hypothetical protein
VCYPSLMLMALAEERVRDLDRQASRAGLRSLEPGRTRPWPIAAFAALTGRPRAGARRTGLAAARARS